MSEISMPLRLVQQVLTMLLFGTWLAAHWIKKRPIPSTTLNLPLLVLTLTLVASAVQARDPRVSLEYTWPTLCFILGYLLLVDVMQQGKQRWIMDGLFLVSAVVVIISLFELGAWYFGYPQIARFAQGWPEIGGLTIPISRQKLAIALNVSTMLGNFCATLIPLAVTWALTARQRDLRFGLWILTVGLVVTLYFSGSRGAMMATLVSSGMLALFFLLRDEVRNQLPRVVQAVLRPRIMIAIALAAGILAVGGILLRTLNQPLRVGDSNRLDLWRSAIAMAQDHPILGVGPYQYGAELRRYGDPDQSLQQDRLVHAHNLPLQILAEGGILAAASVTWLLIIALRAWLNAWKTASPGRRRRLEGGLAAVLGFGVHNLVDTFFHVALILPILIVAAYTVAGHHTPSSARRKEPEQAQSSGRVLTGGLLAALTLAQVAFVPVHAGNLSHARAIRALQQNKLAEALTETRTAQDSDPTLALYPITEAYVLGLMAYEEPEHHLEQAILAHEKALDLNPTWDLGWHNLAALYAQASRFESAIAAETTAIHWNPAPGGYHLKLGEYYETLGNADQASTAYSEALRRSPELASSGFWTQPGHPERQAMRSDAIVYLAEHDTLVTALRVATASGDIPAGEPLAAAITAGRPQDALTLHTLGEWALLVNDDTTTACPACYFEDALQANTMLAQYEYTRMAQAALLQGDLSEAERLARTALFIDSLVVENYAVLAQVADRNGAPPETVNSLLGRAVPAQKDDAVFAMYVYGRSAPFTLLPQARYPQNTRGQLQAWLDLANRYTAAGDTARARDTYLRILERDPYFWEASQQLEGLLESG